MPNPPAKIKFSPTILIRNLPITYWVCLATLGAMGTFHAAVVIMHAYDNVLFEQWLRFAQPAVDVVSPFVKAINEVSHQMMRIGYADRVDLVRNVISIDWIIYTAGLVTALVTCLFDFLIKGRQISDAIYGRVNAAIADKVLYSTVILFYLGFFIGSFLLVFTDGLYTQFALYKSDLSLATSIVFFYAALIFPVAMIALCITLLWETVRRLLQRAPPPPRRGHQ